MPDKKHSSASTDSLDGLEVAGPRWDVLKDHLVPFPGSPGIAIPRRFDALVRDLVNGCTAQLEVEMSDGRPRLRSFAVRADSQAITPTSLRRLPIGSYLNAVVTVAMVKTDVEISDSGRSWIRAALTAEQTGFDEAFTHVKRAAARRRQPVTRERLAEAAKAYREAPKGGKSEHVAHQLGVESSYARQLVHRARKEGLL